MNTVRVAVAGSSGSIGTQTLDVVRTDRERFEVVGLSVGSSVDIVVAQAREFLPLVVAVSDPEARRQVAAALADLSSVEVVADAADMCGVADVVINGIVGFAGLPVTMATLAAGHRLGLANKESLIAAGPVVRPVRATPGAELIPVDSEHCALHQCLRSSSRPDVELSRLVLTASGGPFRGRSAGDLADVTIEDALAHPTWAMGPKITVDSSTLMNKGLEVIEAHELFNVPVDAIDVVVHPQSVVHSMVEFTDGSTIAQLSMPDMRLPIGYAMGWPHRIESAYGTIDWTTLSRLDFEPPDRETFPCLDLAYEAGRTGGTAPAMLSAANEIAVEAFLAGRIRWNQIPDLVVSVLDDVEVHEPTLLDEVVEADHRAREVAMSHLDAMI